jgi:hypothetical protein
MRQPKLWVSVLIVLAIGLHAVPAILRPGARQVTWPFLVWGMYKESRGPGPVTADRRRIVAVTASGSQRELEADVTGLSSPALGRDFVRPMMEGDSVAARRLFQRINAGRSDPFVELRVEIDRYTIADTGLVRNYTPIMAYRLDPADAKRGTSP